MKAVVWGKNSAFVGFLKAAVSDAEVVSAATLREAVDTADATDAEALFLLPDYDDGKHSIEEFTDDDIYALVALIDSERTKVYIENYTSIDTRDADIVGRKQLVYVTPLGRDSIRLLGDFKDKVGTELLQKRDGYFIPTASHGKIEPLAEIRNCIGVHDVIAEEDVDRGVALGRIHNVVYSAFVDITCLNGNFALPYAHWKRLYSALFSEVLGISEAAVEIAFDKTYSGIGTRADISYVRDESVMKSSLEKAVLSSIDWHVESGILPSPDGKRGVYEMVRSFDLNIARNVRSDSSLMTAALFMLAGKYFGNTEWQDISRNIVHEMLDGRELQIKDGANRGLFKWFPGIGKIKTSSVYISDTSRCANSVYALYAMTGDEDLKETLMLTGEAILKWFNGDPFIAGGGLLNTMEWDLDTIQTHPRTSSSEFYEAPMLLLRNLYKATGDERYREQVIKTADALAAVHPGYGVVTSHSKNFTLSRALTVYAAAQSLAPGGWSEQIDDILEYFRGLQHPSGGFADGQAYFDDKSIRSNMEFAIGFGPEHGNVCDMMYCHNTMLYTLNLLCKSDNPGFNYPLAKEMFDKALNFVLNIQIVSDDKHLSGGWMRAYDMDLGEYYGCDKDFGWGAYSILTGWMTGAMPIVLLDMLGMETMY